jgi:hypothetical protein
MALNTAGSAVVGLTEVVARAGVGVGAEAGEEREEMEGVNSGALGALKLCANFNR